MKKFLKIVILTIAYFMVLCLGVSSECLSIEDHIGQFGKDSGIAREMSFDAKLSEHVRGKATIVDFDHSFEQESSTNIYDWTAGNYTIKSPVSVNDFFVEFGKENFSGGAGFKTFQEREGLVSALQDIEYQFFPVDATNPLRMKSISVPSLWGKFNFAPDTYLRVVGFESQWSKISPDAVPDLKRMRLDNPKGDQGYGLYSTFGTRFDNTDVEVGFTRGWSSWPSEERESSAKFAPNPYKVLAGFVKVRQHINGWTLGSTALVKDANENAGCVYNMLFSIDKHLSLWGKPASVGGSYFYVNSFEQSDHLRTSPWEDLGNSFSLRAAIEDRSRQIRHKFESVINHEEKGYYFMGMTEKRISDMVKIGSQMNFYYDSQKYISEEYDSIRIAGYFTFTF
jgi:hypothetical protein